MKKSGGISREYRRKLIVSAVFLFLTGLVYCLAKYLPELMFPWYRDFSRKLLWLLADFTDLFPFSIFEWGMLGLVWLALGWMIKIIAYRRGLVRFLLTAAEIGSGILCLFVVLWGADQFAPTFLSTTEYNESSFSVEEARAAAEYYLEMAEGYAPLVPRDETGLSDFGSFSDIADGVESGYGYLAATYGSRFACGDVTPKGMCFSYVMDMIGLTGIYTGYTGEMSINTDTPDQSLPFTISHELAHRCTVANENDANFAAFLACIHSDEDIYRYSGYYSAFIYVYNAIAKVDKTVQSQLWSSIDEDVMTDILAANAHYKEFEKPVRKAAEKVNDTYLKSFNQSSGINNYGAVAGALISYYEKEIAGNQGDMDE